MSPAEDSDLRTFRSSLRQEAQPDFTLTVADFSWTVHTKKLMKSTYFQKICNDPEFQRIVTLQDVDPVLIGHLILWLYTGDYVATDDGDGNDLTLNKSGIDINIIMRNGKANNKANGNGQKSPELGSAATKSSSSFPFTHEEEERWLVPSAIHAKMYVLSQRYGISELSSLTVEELTNELEWNDSIFLPSLEYLFPPLHLEKDDKDAVWRTPTKDSDVFELLVGTASTGPKLNDVYLPNPTFQKVLRENPDFALEVLVRVTADLHDTKDQLTKLNETLETPPRPKKARKKRAASTSLEKEGA